MALVWTVQRENAADVVIEAWEIIKASGMSIVPLTDEVVAEAAEQCEALGCSLYDALAPACAVLLGATLASADRRAHGDFPGVLIIEEREPPRFFACATMARAHVRVPSRG